MKVFICATEHSADLHAKHLINALLIENPLIEIFGILGPLSEPLVKKENIIFSSEELNVMGFSDVIPKIPHILKIMNLSARFVIENKFDAVICMDAPDFNMRFAERLYRKNVTMIYYITPQVWAWRKERVWDLRRLFDLLIPILPFEPKFYDQFKIPTKYMGHPIMDENDFKKVSKKDFANQMALKNPPLDKPWVAIFPGSRKSEIERHESVLKEFISKNKDCFFIIAAIKPLGWKIDNCQELTNINEKLFSVADKALVKSGTSSLHAALYGVPSIIFYKVSFLNKWIFKLFIRYSGFISLPNLILKKKLFTELKQDAFCYKNLQYEFDQLPSNIEADQLELKRLLGSGCAKKIAREIINVVNKK